MNDLRELYQEMILDHNKKPRNFLVLADADRKADGYNPLCGDRITVYIKLSDNRIEDIAFQGSGCAISRASASMMTSSLKGMTREEAAKMFDEYHRMLSGKLDIGTESHHLGKLAVFSGVSEFPARVKCATLAWHTLKAGLEGKAESVTTEKES